MNSDPRDAALGIDVGGTKAAGVVIDAQGSVLRSATVPTPTTSATDFVEAITSLCDELGGGPSLPLGIGMPGLVNLDGVLVSSPHLGCCVGLDLADTFRERRVVVRNDAEGALVAEQRLGAAKGIEDALLLTIGTGIGGALLMGGVLQCGAHGFAGEPGHLCVVPDGEACPCGQRGCFERYVSGPALARLGRRSGLGGEDLDGVEVMAMAEAGDPMALSAVATMGAWLGRGLASIVAVLDPGVILLGGGTGSASELLCEAARGALANFLMGGEAREVPEIRRTALGEQAGAIGMALVGVGT